MSAYIQLPMSPLSLALKPMRRPAAISLCRYASHAGVAQIAAQLNNPVRLRAASALLAQSHAALKNFEAALQAATRTLELTQKLKFNRLEAIDLYNVGLFNLMLKRPTEAVSLFRQAKDKMDATEPGFQKELLFGNCSLQSGRPRADDK